MLAYVSGASKAGPARVRACSRVRVQYRLLRIHQFRHELSAKLRNKSSSSSACCRSVGLSPSFPTAPAACCAGKLPMLVPSASTLWSPVPLAARQRERQATTFSLGPVFTTANFSELFAQEPGRVTVSQQQSATAVWCTTVRAVCVACALTAPVIATVQRYWQFKFQKKNGSVIVRVTSHVQAKVHSKCI
jgi:hypothetical protein